MLKFAVVVLVGVLALANGSVSYAGPACCGAAKATAPAMTATKCMAACTNALSQLTLTDDQKAKIAALQAECPKGNCTKAAAEKCMSGMAAILTPEQMTAFKAARATECAKMKKVCGAKDEAGAASKDTTKE